MSKDIDSPTQDSGEIERRQLVRVEDTAIVELSPLPNVVPMHNDQASSSIQQKWVDSSDASDDKLFYLMRELQQIDAESNTALNSLKNKQPELAACLEALNRKINSIGETLCDDLFDSGTELQAIDLSAGGIGFNHSERLLEGSFHRLKVWFNNSNVGICVQIKVLACNRAISGGFHISAMFSSIQPTDLQIVQKHITQVEAQMRREAAALRSVLDHDEGNESE